MRRALSLGLNCSRPRQSRAVFRDLRWSSSTATRQWSTPLAKQLGEAITTTGPVSLAAYMRQCLTSPAGGYYTSTQDGRDQFGQRGDFITSPEISQIFGELLGIWFYAEWLAQGRKKNGVELIEVGPGRGTLMDDMLRTLRNFKALYSRIETVYMVEAGEALRTAQQKLLCGDAPREETATGFKSKSKYGGAEIVWCDHIKDVPRSLQKSPFIVAHEFFDALPIHAFQSIAPRPDQATSTLHGVTPRASTVPQWRELVVSPTPPKGPELLGTSSLTKPIQPDFQLTLEKASNPESLLLPELSERYRALKGKAGSIIEISPEGQLYAEDFARRIGGGGESGAAGAALILDYGPSDTIPINSLRGIRSHRTTSPFAYPGQVDLSADVDFTALAEAGLKASPHVEVHGPVEQGFFLQSMGIRERAEQLVRTAAAAAGDDEKRRRIESGWKRLVERGGGGMGKIYKAMAIVPNSEGRRRPVGFGGDVRAE